MKKTTSKTSKSPAPATKPAKPVAKKKVAPAIAPVAVKPATTVITAQIDVGFGNALYVRGDGPGLSWDRGVLMESMTSDGWRIILAESTRPIAFKLLLNDEVWSVGEDYKATSGVSLTVVPVF